MKDETESLEVRSVDSARRQATLARARQARLVVVTATELRLVLSLDEHR